jgi:hypothetical protein
MTVTLSNELADALAEQGDIPLRTVNPATHEVYFLVSEDRYERLKPLFEDDPMSLSEQRKLIEHAGERAEWDAPEMDAYDRYDENRT